MKSLILTAAAMMLTVPAFGANLVVNGDFQTGVLTPSFTTYTQDNTMIPPATWNIVSFDTLHPQWVDFTDHTTGDSEVGKYMIVNGTDQGLGPAWGQTINVDPHTDYNLSAWFASLFPESPASLQFRIIGLDDGDYLLDSSNVFLAPLPPGVWGQSTFQFNSNFNTSVRVEIWDVNQVFTGNDYAIDDISVEAVPAPGALALLGLGGFAATRRRRA